MDFGGVKMKMQLRTGVCFVCHTECNKDAYCHGECALAYSNKNNEYRELNKFLKKLKKLIKNQGGTEMISISELEKLIAKYE